MKRLLLVLCIICTLNTNAQIKITSKYQPTDYSGVISALDNYAKNYKAFEREIEQVSDYIVNLLSQKIDDQMREFLNNKHKQTLNVSTKLSQNGLTASIRNELKSIKTSIQQEIVNYNNRVAAHNAEVERQARENAKPNQPKSKNRNSQNCIFYTSTNGNVIKPKSDVFGAKIISNTYQNGQGIIEFDGPVTLIGKEAFKNVEHLRSISIPSSVTWVGCNAFKGCNMLNKVDITDLAAWCKIEFEVNYANNTWDVEREIVFNKRTKLCLNGIDLNNITIPAKVTKIGRNAFAGFYNITSVIIPNSVTSIGHAAFYDCYNLKKMTIGNGVTSIGKEAFHSCDKLESVTIGKSVTSIGCSAFSGCPSLTSVTIPDSVTEIGGSAFCGCTSLTSVTIGNSVTEIGDYTFLGCTSLTSITIPDSVTSIGKFAFANCDNLTSVTIGNSITDIGVLAFNIYGKPEPNIYIPERTIYCKSDTPPAIYKCGLNNRGLGQGLGSFWYYDNLTIYVPRNVYKSYIEMGPQDKDRATRYNWRSYKKYIKPYDFE